MKKNIEWVFLLLETKDNEMIFVRENNENNRPWKREWQHFFPAWTKEPWESLQKTINREFEEETWLNWATTIVQETLINIGTLFLETDDYYLKAHVYTGFIPSSAEVKTHKFNSQEISGIKVAHPQKILQENIENLRPWLIEALLLKYHIPSDIIYIENWLYKNKEEVEWKKVQLQSLYQQE